MFHETYLTQTNGSLLLVHNEQCVISVINISEIHTSRAVPVGLLLNYKFRKNKLFYRWNVWKTNYTRLCLSCLFPSDTKEDKMLHIQERSVIVLYFLSLPMPRSKRFQSSPVWSHICWFPSASNCKWSQRKFKFLPCLSDPVVTKSSTVSVQSAWMLLDSVFLFVCFFALV